MRIRIRVEPQARDVAATLQSLYWDRRRIDIIEMINRWYGPDYCYVKVKAHDGSVYFLCCDENHNEWELTMFVSARGQALAARTLTSVPATGTERTNCGLRRKRRSTPAHHTTEYRKRL
jgi:hypothetical protein